MVLVCCFEKFHFFSFFFQIGKFNLLTLRLKCSLKWWYSVTLWFCNTLSFLSDMYTTLNLIYNTINLFLISFKCVSAGTTRFPKAEIMLQLANNSTSITRFPATNHWNMDSTRGEEGREKGKCDARCYQPRKVTHTTLGQVYFGSAYQGVGITEVGNPNVVFRGSSWSHSLCTACVRWSPLFKVPRWICSVVRKRPSAGPRWYLAARERASGQHVEKDSALSHHTRCVLKSMTNGGTPQNLPHGFIKHLHLFFNSPSHVLVSHNVKHLSWLMWEVNTRKKLPVAS